MKRSILFSAVLGIIAYLLVNVIFDISPITSWLTILVFGIAGFVLGVKRYPKKTKLFWVGVLAGMLFVLLFTAPYFYKSHLGPELYLVDNFDDPSKVSTRNVGFYEVYSIKKQPHKLKTIETYIGYGYGGIMFIISIVGMMIFGRFNPFARINRTRYDSSGPPTNDDLIEYKK